MKNEKAKHTPGPWRYKRGQLWKNEAGEFPPVEIKVPQGLYTIYHQVKEDGATYWAHADLVENKSDARLIAACPELLAALEMAVLDFDSAEGIGPWINKARAAIAKAKGE